LTFTGRIVFPVTPDFVLAKLIEKVPDILYFPFYRILPYFSKRKILTIRI